MHEIKFISFHSLHEIKPAVYKTVLHPANRITRMCGYLRSLSKVGSLRTIFFCSSLFFGQVAFSSVKLQPDEKIGFCRLNVLVWCSGM
jgi:hypothetical protein